MEFVKNGEIVLNVGVDATSSLRLGNDFIEFKARFGGVAREIVVPISHVVAIYARENGQGMAFPAPAPATLAAVKPVVVAEAQASGDEVEGVSGGVSRSPLRSVKNDVNGESKGDEPPDPTDDLPDPPTDGPGRPPGRPQLKRVK